jgi:ankyrin repeat protein
MVCFEDILRILFKSRENRFKDIKILKYLEENGLKVDLGAVVDPRRGTTFFMFIVMFAEKTFVGYLKRKYAVNINTVDKAGRSALSLAIIEGCTNIVEYLVNKLDVDVNTVDNGGTSALSRSCISKFPCLDIVKCLVEKGAHLETADGDGKTAVTNAVINNHFKIVEYLAKSGSNMGVTDKEDNTLLILAARNGHIGMVRFLIENSKANIHSKNIYGRTALMESIASPTINLWSGFGPFYLCFEGTIGYLIGMGHTSIKTFFC